MKQKYKNKLQNIENQMANLEVQQTQEIEALDDTCDIKDFMNGMKSENSEYFQKLTDIWLKYKDKHANLSAEYIALFLIATNIAVRNKPLHSDTAIKLLKEIGTPTAQQISFRIEPGRYNPYVLNQYAYIYTKLYQQYGVKLLDENYAKYLYKQIHNTQERVNLAIIKKDKNANITDMQKQIDTFTKEFNLFNETIRNKVINEQLKQALPY